MIKLVGAILVLVSAYAIGSLLALQVKEQEKWLKDIKTALFLLMGELEYRQVPLPDALTIIGKRHGGRLSSFFQSLSGELFKKLLALPRFREDFAEAQLFWEIPDTPGAAGDFINCTALKQWQLKDFAGTRFLVGTVAELP
jgi:hypothetical protein